MKPGIRINTGILFFLFIYPFSCLLAQENYPRNYFRSPIDTVLKLAGNFGEIRPNHFHAGMDIRTGNHEGMKVYAVADGYVSRIKISGIGYGKVLYITHPNGFVSVYAHLSKFNDTIGKYIRKAQYSKESFEVELFPKPNELPVKKSDLIALSGNTGNTAGPHLHFEIRDEKTEFIINPLFFGFDIKDDVKPKITAAYIYPVDEKSRVNNQNSFKQLPFSGKSGEYKTLPTDIVTVSGNIGCGIEVWDTESNSSNHNAVFSIELLMDGKRIYYSEMDKFSFDQSRGVNSHIDYVEKKIHGRSIQKSFVAKNNKLNIYKELKNRGIMSFMNDSIHNMTYVIKDYFGNTSTLKFKLKGSSTSYDKNTPAASKYTAIFHCEEPNQFKTQNCSMSLPANILYEDLRFQYSVSNDSVKKGSIAPIFHIHNDLVPVHSYYTLALKPNNPLPERLQKKALIVSVSPGGGKHSEGGEWKDGFITTQTRIFGNFTIALDTVPPYIKPKNISKGKDLSKQRTIEIIAGDNLSGLKSYPAYIDDKWVLMEYEPKKNLLYYTFDSSIKKGKHTFLIEVKDERGNASTFKANFTR